MIANLLDYIPATFRGLLPAILFWIVILGTAVLLATQ